MKLSLTNNGFPVGTEIAESNSQLNSQVLVYILTKQGWCFNSRSASSGSTVTTGIGVLKACASEDVSQMLLQTDTLGTGRTLCESWNVCTIHSMLQNFSHTLHRAKNENCQRENSLPSWDVFAGIGAASSSLMWWTKTCIHRMDT